MLKKIRNTMVFGALVMTAPIAAQEQTSGDARMLEAMGTMFGQADPLTAAQEQRVAAAELVVEKIFPEGTYAKMMEDTMKPMMEGMTGAMMQMPASELAKLTGLDTSALEEMGEGTLGDAIAIMDPAYTERSKRITSASIRMITDLMNRIEPSYRAGLARAYAVRFSEAQLADLNAFFQTPTGSHYAAESMLIYTDPQVMSAMNEMMPAMMDMMPAMVGEMAEATADLPEARRYSQLTEAEQAKLAAIFGVTRRKLAEREPAAETAEEF